MADFFPEITEKIKQFISEQAMFFVATAPNNGRINLSPKGLSTFRVLGPNLVGYLDLVGSGNETAAHLLDDGRITFMFCSFTRNALILRLYGRGRSARPGDAEFNQYISAFPKIRSARQIILADIDTAQTSCGYGVPEMELTSDRATLEKWADAKSDEELEVYKREKNTTSIDGLPTGLYD